MPVRSPREHISSLTRRGTVGDPSDLGRAASEGRSVFEGIASALMFRPKTVLLFAHLARNGLIREIDKEISAVKDLESVVNDLGNQSYAIHDLSDLRGARNSLVQMESSSSISSDTVAVKRFDGSIGRFLKGPIAKNVYAGRTGALRRCGKEAEAELRPVVDSAVRIHEEVMDRVYALLVGVRNFEAAPLDTIVSVKVVSRVRKDLESLIDSIENDPFGASSRDAAVRAVSDRAMIRSLSGSWSPFGKIVHANVESVESFPSARVGAGPFVIPSGCQVSVDGNVLGFPMPGIDLSDRSFVMTDPLPSQITIPVGGELYLDAGGTRLRVRLNEGEEDVELSLQDVVSLLSQSIGAVLLPGTGRIVLYSDASYLSVRGSDIGYDTENSLGYAEVYDSSSHDLLGLRVGATGSRGVLGEGELVVFWNSLFSSVTAYSDPDGIVLQGIDGSPGAALDVSGAEFLGVSGPYVPESALLRFDSVQEMCVGDVVRTPSGDREIVYIEGTLVRLDSPVPTFSGTVSVISRLELSYLEFFESFSRVATNAVKDRPFRDAKAIRAASALQTSSSPAIRGDVARGLRDVVSVLEDLKKSLGSGLPSKSGTYERRTARRILDSLEERKFDRAADYLCRCKVYETLSMDSEDASYAGELARRVSEVGMEVATESRSSRSYVERVSGQEGLL